ncbi:uncharacterized protein LOC119584880 [Penaeus monodon]|uniref:uncharacterized protein LOC119584880 n=1 Tax=Penaeus monodon TaxID=6687 RepID=UPI0018A71FD2|nr:uncharacterized protein LOC119584880 [Penaeus monodon]XP_037789435.1 uncharacterized protein LOC119584880 [Penaeus monodon]
MSTWWQAVRVLAGAILLSTLVSGKELENLVNFRQRECRQRIPRGDVADLLPESLQKIHPRNLKVLSRQRRFLAWPSGSTLTVTPAFSIPVASDDFQSVSMYLALPFILDLPDAPLRLIKSESTTASPYGYGSYANTADTRYDSSNSNGDSNHLGYGTGSSYTSYGGYEQFNHYYGDDSHYGGFGKRSIDSHRQAGFNVIQNGLENMGLPGKSCLLRTVCEVAREPVTDLGVVGEILNLLFAAGYGEGSEAMHEYVVAEEKGRREGDCEGRYNECPLGVASLIHSGVSHLFAGLASTGVQGSGLL